MTDRKLTYRIQSLAELPFMVLESAHWTPQAAKLREKEQAELKAGQPERAKTYRLLRRAWAREETWINASLSALVMGLPQALLADVLRDFLGGLFLPDGQVAKLGTAGISDVVGDPDLIICGNNASVFVESKVAAHAKSHRYSFQQFTKYMALASIANCATDEGFKRNSVHLVLTPTLDPDVFCNDVQQWLPTVCDRRLVVDAANLRVRDAKKRFGDYASWANHMMTTLLGKIVTGRCSLDETAVRRLFADGSPVLVPTYIVTYRDFLGDVRTRCLAAGLESQSHAANVLTSLVYGDYVPMADPD